MLDSKKLADDAGDPDVYCTLAKPNFKSPRELVDDGVDLPTLQNSWQDGRQLVHHIEKGISSPNARSIRSPRSSLHKINFGPRGDILQVEQFALSFVHVDIGGAMRCTL